MTPCACSHDCGRAAYAMGYSLACYKRWDRAGRPDTGPPPPMTHAERTARATAALRGQTLPATGDERPAPVACPPARNVPDDPVARATAVLPLLARAGDRAAAARVLAPLSPAQLCAVAFTLAVSADREPPRQANRMLDGHAAYKRMRARGIERHEMPAWVVTAEREYMRLAQSRKTARRAAAQEESDAA